MSVDKNNLFSNLKYDFPSGLVVYLVALPLCLGVALASTGRPDLLFSGIIAGMIGGIVVGFLSGSALGVSGPAAGLVVIVLNALDTLGSFEAFLLAVVIAGILQVIAGLMKAGIIGYYFPSSIIKGMLAAIGITLILKEIPHAFGYDADFMGDEAFDQKDGQNTFTELFNAVRYSSTGAIIISAVSLGLLILFDKPFMKRIQLFRFVPGALFVVITGIFLNILFATLMPGWALSGDHMVQLPVASSAGEFFSFFKSPDFSAINNVDVYTIGLTLAIVASLETLLCVEATDKLDPYKRNTPTNRELIAQGIGNITSGLIGGLPVTQVIVRSSANIDSGGRTKMSTIIHGSILLLSALFIPAYLNYIPLASLAAILLMVGYKLSKFSLYQGMYKLGKEQFIPFIVTIIAILSTDLLKGIAIGMVVAIYFILRKNYKHSYHYFKENHRDGDVITLILSEEVTFLNKGSISATLDNLPDGSTVVIDGSKSLNIDYDVLEIIQDFKKHSAPLRNISVKTVGIHEVAVIGGH
ncbi:SulP family inorganic anion transporter [Dyadobacter sediminis]|uniref:SulP family inorganic anion transporter n=1 Tax=Dyadobacter sediminis TaxID=1493691 RepID=A0A5R9KDZ5_9BACT|nr:SulP family inorganic anion transporter [Dyadobacter sediminis]TLU94375.1 SulP family inorganic anion transporter [Dyadobacter sediminis]GGB91807.1 sulfate permease [Dyadobacter sediminis]